MYSGFLAHDSVAGVSSLLQPVKVRLLEQMKYFSRFPDHLLIRLASVHIAHCILALGFAMNFSSSGLMKKKSQILRPVRGRSLSVRTSDLESSQNVEKAMVEKENFT